MPAGGISVSGKRADCLGGRGAPCANTVRGLMSPVAGTFTRDGRHVYVGSIYMGGLVSLQRDPATGRLRPVSAGSACIGYQQGCDRIAHPMPTDVELTHDERFVYAPGSRSDGLLGFARDPATGALSQAPDACVAWDDYQDYQDKCRSDKTMGRPLAMDLSPDGSTLYVAAEEDQGGGKGGLLIYARDAATGALTLTGRQLSTTPDKAKGYLEVVVAPDGRNVYAVAEGWDVHAFTRDPATGALTRIPGGQGCFGMSKGCTWLKGVFDPEDLRMSPDGANLYIAASGGISVLRRDAGGGLRQLPGKAACLMVKKGEVVARRPQCRTGRFKSRNVSGLESAPDGRHLYALQADSDGRQGTGVLQLVRRK